MVYSTTESVENYLLTVSEGNAITAELRGQSCQTEGPMGLFRRPEELRSGVGGAGCFSGPGAARRQPTGRAGCGFAPEEREPQASGHITSERAHSDRCNDEARQGKAVWRENHEGLSRGTEGM